MRLIKRSRSNSGIHADYTPNLGNMSNIKQYDQLIESEYDELRSFKAYLSVIEGQRHIDGILWEFYEIQNRLKVIVPTECFDLNRVKDFDLKNVDVFFPKSSQLVSFNLDNCIEKQTLIRPHFTNGYYEP